jgi:hypothetical protein
VPFRADVAPACEIGVPGAAGVYRNIRASTEPPPMAIGLDQSVKTGSSPGATRRVTALQSVTAKADSRGRLPQPPWTPGKRAAVIAEVRRAFHGSHPYLVQPGNLASMWEVMADAAREQDARGQAISTCTSLTARASGARRAGMHRARARDTSPSTGRSATGHRGSRKSALTANRSRLARMQAQARMRKQRGRTSLAF